MRVRAEVVGNPGSAREVTITVGFDGEITTASELRSAAISGAGKRYRVSADIGSVDLRGVRPSALVTFVWDPGRTVGGITFNESQNMRFEGAAGRAMDIQPASSSFPNRNLQFFRCTFGGTSASRLNTFALVGIREFTLDLLFDECEFGWTRSLGTSQDQGFGFRAVDNGGAGPIDGLTIRKCRLHHLACDAFDFAGVQNFEIAKCEVSYIADYPPGSDVHPDPLMLRGLATGVMRDSWIHHTGYYDETHQPGDGYPAGQLLLHNPTIDFQMINVLATDHRNYVPIFKDPFSANLVMRNCTIMGGQPQPDRGSSVVIRGQQKELTDTIIRSYGADGTAGWTTAGGNLCATGGIPGGQQAALSFDNDWNCTSHPGKGYTKPADIHW